jgi:AcrR family transcriptional regulator
MPLTGGARATVNGMTEVTRRTQGVQRGPRSVQVVENVRAAALAELARAGFAGLTIDGVAKAANVNRTTIYRRWPTKAALLATVVEPLLARFDTDPDTGTAYGDLLVLMTVLRDNAAMPESRALVEAVTSRSAGELRELVLAVSARALAPFLRVLDRAVRRGELGDDTDVQVIAYLAFHGIAMWEQTHDSPASDEDCARVLRVVLTA